MELIEITPQTQLVWIVSFVHPRDGSKQEVTYHSKDIAETFCDWLECIGVKFKLSLKLTS